jgi:hypothetical protein
MMSKLVRYSCLSLISVVLASVSVGCGDPNEAEFKAGGPEGKGTADPKYSSDTPETYKQFHQDSTKAATKEKAAAAPEKK